MKQKVVIFLSVLFTVIISVGIATGVSVLNHHIEVEEQKAKYEIVVPDVFDVYVGQENRIIPYLISTDGTVQESRFDYQLNTSDVSISYDGNITINNIPNKDVCATITERNTQTTTEVKLNIISALSNVLGFIAPDGSLIEGDQNLLLGSSFGINIITEPRGYSIQNYCDIHSYDSNGNEKNIFELSYDKDIVNLKVVGLGSGVLHLGVKNASGESIYQAQLNFNISTREEKLGDLILNQTGKTLLSDSDLSGIDTIQITNDVYDLSELSNLSGLKSVYFLEDDLADYIGVSSKYVYRVKSELFNQYASDVYWSNFIENIIPYDDIGDVFVVYHSEKSTKIAYEKVSNEYVLAAYNTTGYINTKWVGKDGTAYNTAKIKAINKDGIHLFAEWEPIKYKITYKLRNSGDTISENWDYETYSMFKKVSDFSSYSLNGYKFVGWTDDKFTDMFSSFVKYKSDEYYKEITDENNSEIFLYDIWAPIEYTLKFNLPDTAQSIEDTKLKYDQEYVLLPANMPGYTFVKWKLPDGSSKNSGEIIKNLTNIDGGELTLTPEFTENSYTINFDTNNGTPSSISSKTLKYTEYYTLPQLSRLGYDSYVWYYDANGNMSKDAGEKTYTATERVNKIAESGSIYLRAYWTSVSYSVYYDYKGGVDVVGRNSYTETQDYDHTYYFPLITKTGSTLVKWIKQSDSSELNPDAPLYQISTTNGSSITYYAVWSVNSYDLTIATGEGTSLSVKVNGETKGDGTYSVKYGTDITVAYSANTGYKDAVCNFEGGTMPANDFTISSSATIQRHNVTISVGGGSYMTVNIGGVEYSNSTTVSDVAYGTSISVVSYGANGGYQNAGYSCAYSSMPDCDITISSWAEKTPEPSCLAKGTKISTRDGVVNVEDLSVGDSVLAFDQITGEIVDTKIAFTYYAYSEVDIINLVFDNGKTIKLLNDGHGLFDSSKNKYILVSADNVESLVGDEFLFVTNANESILSSAKLISFNISKGLVERYDIVTEDNLNHIANGFIACSDTLVGLCNVFDFDDSHLIDQLKMEEDINAYGLFIYEEWAEYVTLEEFNKFNGAYFKIALAKGLMTEEELFGLISDVNTYSSI